MKLDDSLGNELVLKAICDRYRELEIPFRQLEHVPTKTSEESARVRGESLEIGGKALLLKVGKEFCLFVLPAHRKLNSAKIKNHLETKKLRFATREELVELTGLVPGSVPPFGHPVLPFKLFMDDGFRSQEKIAFNAGMLSVSHVLQFEDYLRVAEPEFFSFSDLP